MVRNRVVGLVAAVVAALALILVFHPPTLPWQSVFRFEIASPPFSQLGQDATVYLAGQQVGHVEGVTMQGGTPVLTVQINGGDAHLMHANAAATIRSHGLLGTEFVDLNGGTTGAFPPGGVIPVSHVQVAVTLQQALNVFQTTERQNLQTLVDQLGVAAAGRGRDVNDSLKALSAASDSLAQVTDTLRAHDQGLSSIIDSSQQLSGSLQNTPLGAQIANTDTVLSGVAQVDNSLGQGIDHTASVLSDLDVVLHDNAGNLSYTLARAPHVTVKLRTLLAETSGLLNGINPALPALMTSVVEAQSAFSGTDANGHYVRVMSVLGTCTVGLNLGCSGGPGQGGPPVNSATSTGSRTAPQPSPSISDQGLLNLLFGNG